jgi:hypothetical protein
MLKTLTKSLFALMVLFNATAAYSQFYFGVAAGTASVDLPDEYNDLAEIVDDAKSIPGIDASADAQDSDTGLKLFAGTHLGEHLAVEFGYIDLGETSFDFSLIDDGSATGDPSTTIIAANSSVSGLSFAGVGKLPFSDTSSLNGRVGIYLWESESDVSFFDTTGFFGNFSDSSTDDGNDVFYGVGLNINWFELHYDVYDIDGEDVDFIGVSARFESE